MFPSRAAPGPRVEGWGPSWLVGCGDPGEPALGLEEGVRCAPP